MRVTTLGHASLYVETRDQRILIDPSFGETLAGGALRYHPARTLRLGDMPPPSLLVVTHGHFDHFLPESLGLLSPATPVLTADDADLIAALAELGFGEVGMLQPWVERRWGQTRLVPTPSSHEEPEIGLAVQDDSGTLWHMADAEVDEQTGQRVHRELGAVDVVSVKYQPLVRSSMGYQRGMGAAFDKREVVGWLDAACAAQPALAFPYAAGLRFAGRHRWFNRYAFALSPEEVARLLQRRLGAPERARVMDPGDVIELSQGAPPRRRAQASPFVQRVDDGSCVSWEPVDTSTLAGLDDPRERRALEQRLGRLLAGPLRAWIETQLESGGLWNREFWRDVVWQLVVHLGDGERALHFAHAEQGGVCFGRGEHTGANFFTHLSGRGLLEVLDGVRPPLLFWLTGDARSYEKVIGVREGRFSLPDWPAAPEDQPSDPLTFYLRRVAPPARLGDLDSMVARPMDAAQARRGALLAELAHAELRRQGVALAPEEVQRVADEFRLRFELLDEGETERWLGRSGLDLEAFSRLMHDVAAVRKLLRQGDASWAARVADHVRLASVRARDDH